MKKLLKAGILALSILAARTLPAENLEKKVERHSYEINYITKIGASEFYYTEKDNKYNIKINATIENLFNTPFFNKEYTFETKGAIQIKEFISNNYIFKSRDKTGKFLTEVIQRFDFDNLKVNSTRYIISGNKRKLIYDKINPINKKTRDILSALMELRVKPIQKIYNFNIVEQGENKRYDLIYKGIEKIKIKNKTYQAYKFKIIDPNRPTNSGENAILYLNTNKDRDILKLIIKDYFISGITIELSK